MLANVRTLMERVQRLDKDVRPLKGKQVFKAAIRQGAKDRMEILRVRDWVRVALCELLEVRVGA